MIDKLASKAVSIAQRAAYGAPPTDAPEGLQALRLERLDGEELPHADLQGRVVLFVNVASRCGLTPQYEALVELYHRYQDRGLLVVGVPCNQFLGQEPGSAEQIAEFCSATYGVDFPLLAKQDVNGAQRSPLYQWLIAATGGADIGWNFEKILVGRDGAVVARFSPRTPPLDPTVVAAIEAALG